MISDSHEGLEAAVAKVLKATWQRCKVHFLRNALAHAGKGQRQMVLAMINTVFAQESLGLLSRSGASSPISCVTSSRSSPRCSIAPRPMCSRR